MTWCEYKVEVTITKNVTSSNCRAAYFEAGRMSSEYVRRNKLIKDDVVIKYKVIKQGRKRKPKTPKTATAVDSKTGEIILSDPMTGGPR